MNLPRYIKVRVKNTGGSQYRCAYLKIWADKKYYKVSYFRNYLDKPIKCMPIFMSKDIEKAMKEMDEFIAFDKMTGGNDELSKEVRRKVC